MNSKSTWLILGLTLLSFYSGCSEKEKPVQYSEEKILAHVGDQVITVSDFRKSYETGFGHLKTGTDRKRSYLDLMINEKLLALEGYRLGLDDAAWIQQAEKKLMDELLIEALIEKEVKSKIRVTEEEIREEINKSKVSFKFRFWVEPTFDRANRIAEEMRRRGYAEVTDDLLRNSEVPIKPDDLETDYLTYADVSPELLDAIRDLPYGEISDPVNLNGSYFIFQVLDIRRSAVTETEYSTKAPRFEQIIFYRKLHEELPRYIGELLEPKNIATKGESFTLLANALKEWGRLGKDNQGKFLAAVKQATEKQPALKALADNFRKPFMTYKGGSLSIEEFLRKFDTSKISSELKNQNGYLASLNEAIKLTIRDYFLAQRARSQELQRLPELKKEQALWRDKWVYQETRHHFTGDVEVTEKEIETYFAKYKDRYKIRKDKQPELSEFHQQVKQEAYREEAVSVLNRKIESLKDRYPVKIEEAVLDTITVTDFKKSRWANMQVFKAGTKRIAFPSVDPIWRGVQGN